MANTMTKINPKTQKLPILNWWFPLWLTAVNKDYIKKTQLINLNIN